MEFIPCHKPKARYSTLKIEVIRFLLFNIDSWSRNLNRVFRVNFSTSSWSFILEIPKDIEILNSESYELPDLDLNLEDWNIPNVPTNQIYKSSWSLKKAFKTDNHVKTIEQAYGKNKEYKTCYFLSLGKLSL